MIDNLFNAYRKELIQSLIILGMFLILWLILRISLKKIGKKSNINSARVNLIIRYTTVTLFLLVMLIEAFIFGVHFEDIAVVFSSVFAILGIALFAIWSILSNVTSGIIMFFSFPYKIGDTIRIHDKDMPIEAEIEDIKAFHLHLRTADGELITYPNNLILQKAVSLVQVERKHDDGKEAL